MVLPREDARELYQKLRREEATRQIPIVTVTARVEDVADTRLLKDAGVEAVLLKPCEPTRLLAEIRRILEQSRSLREHAMQLRARADEVQTRAMTLYDRSRPQQARKRTRLEAQAAEIAQRIRGEFREMRGLQLTLAQAARLWDVDRDTCQRILDGLVAEKFLAVRTGRYFMIAS
jgi:DNA-binding response OmpR family regulator